MIWLVVIVLGAFLAILFKWVDRALRVFSGTLLLRICGSGVITLAAGIDKCRPTG